MRSACVKKQVGFGPVCREMRPVGCSVSVLSVGCFSTDYIRAILPVPSN